LHTFTLDFISKEESLAYEKEFEPKMYSFLLTSLLIFPIIPLLFFVSKLIFYQDDIFLKQSIIFIGILFLALAFAILASKWRPFSGPGLVFWALISSILIFEGLYQEVEGNTLFNKAIFLTLSGIYIEAMLLMDLMAGKINFIIRCLLILVIHIYFCLRMFDQAGKEGKGTMFFLYTICAGIEIAIQYTEIKCLRGFFHKQFGNQIFLEQYKILLNEIIGSPIIITSQYGETAYFANNAAKELFGEREEGILSNLKKIKATQEAVTQSPRGKHHSSIENLQEDNLQRVDFEEILSLAQNKMKKYASLKFPGMSTTSNSKQQNHMKIDYSEEYSFAAKIFTYQHEYAEASKSSEEIQSSKNLKFEVRVKFFI